ncbi:MAG: hypothetical protein JSS87_06690 [Acidobacteria bacterium]|nr:hypothetical protein [Acidobacteriota bacterium]
MAHALLLYNPKSGSGAAGQLVPQLLAILRQHYPDIEAEATHAPASAGTQVQNAAERGVRHVFVCGGDGTLLEALQGAVHRDVTLGVLPLGTGNVVARELGLKLNPLRAAHQLLSFTARRIPVGVAEHLAETGKSYFLAAAGAGLHAELMAVPKTGTGRSRAHYFREGARLASRPQAQSFQLRIIMPDGTVRTEDASEVLVMRVRSFWGALKLWHPGLGLASDQLRIIFTRSHHRMRLAFYLGRCLLGFPAHTDEHVISLLVKELECSALTDIPAQLDGDPFGNLPVRFSSEPDALSLLMPSLSRP